MVIIQTRSRRKVSGGRYIAYRKKKLYEIGREPSMTKLDEKVSVKTIHTKGGGRKQRVLKTNIANLYDPKSKAYSKSLIKTVVENPANRNFVRRNIITKGSIVMTDKGKARVTSRPGQDGFVNAVLV
jgi:small subunit ribosomal protein S8e